MIIVRRFNVYPWSETVSYLHPAVRLAAVISGIPDDVPRRSVKACVAASRRAADDPRRAHQAPARAAAP